jgi:hypothetical protein
VVELGVVLEIVDVDGELEGLLDGRATRLGHRT